MRQVCFGQLNALGVGNRKRLAHGGDKTAALLGARLRGASVGPAVGHAGLVDAVVEHEFGPHAVRNIALDGMGDAAGAGVLCPSYQVNLAARRLLCPVPRSGKTVLLRLTW